MAAPNGGTPNNISSNVPQINISGARTHSTSSAANGSGISGHAPSTTFSRESSLGPAGSDTSESSVDSSNQLKPRKLFRIRSRAGEITFGKLMTQPQGTLNKLMEKTSNLQLHRYPDVPYSSHLGTNYEGSNGSAGTPQ
ncbi:hypothetical protein ElyMa_000386700 [Elysia marginata]|uniref:Uncharacterized protein n=1 Tax=Elysia marginata TaxID=1093978 RepID=A0AAV4FKF0_9GAST|nr:hypothetical protein ElyMa_000386700 [Elysia marginata]